MTLYYHNFINFIIMNIRVKVANGDTTLAEGYSDVLINLKQDKTLNLIIVKNV
jgi:hypothetical protein